MKVHRVRIGRICLLALFVWLAPQASAQPRGTIREDRQPATALTSLEPELTTVRDLKEEINLYNLILGLQLGRSQMLEILKLAEEAAAMQREYLDSCRRPEVVQSVRSLDNVLACLKKGRFAPKEVELMAHAAEAHLLRLRRDYFARLNALETKVWDLLSPAQRLILTNYRECLIPEADVKNPVNLGQAEVSEHLVDLLGNIRNLPETDLDAALDKVVGEMFAQLDKKFRLTALGSADRERARIKEVFKRARALSAVDFELQKAELAKEAKPQFVNQLHAEVESFQKKMQQMIGGVSKIGKQLLHPKVIPILRARMTAPLVTCDDSPEETRKKYELLSTLNREGKPAPSVEKLADYLGLSDLTRQTFSQIIVNFQKQALKIFMTKSEQGSSPFLVMMRAKTSGLSGPESAALLQQAFVETFPGRAHSFLEELVGVKLKTYAELRKQLNEHTYSRFQELDVDLLDIRTGYEIGKGEWAAGNGGVESDLGEEPNLVAVTRRLHLDQAQSERVHTILVEHQKAVGQLLRKGEPGKTPFDALQQVFLNQGSQEHMTAFLTTLQNRIGSGTETYFESLLECNRETWLRLERELPADVFTALARLNLDISKIKTGYNPFTGEACSWQDLEFQEKGERLRERHGIGKKAKMTDLFTLMSVQDEKVKEMVLKTLQEGQKKAFTLLSQPGESGEPPLDKLTLTGGAEGMKTFFKALMGKVKGKTTTFMQELETIKRDTFDKLKDVLPNAPYLLFRSLNLDLLDIDAGYNLGFEIMKRRVSSW